jgi:hypothetical protein
MHRKALKYLKQGILFNVIKNRLLEYFRMQGYKYTRTFNYYRDIKNRIRYGPSAPIFAERIWVNPQHCAMTLIGFDQKHSGKVIESFWPIKQAIPVHEIPKIKFCVGHWVKGLSWEDTGAYKHWIKGIPWTDTTVYKHMQNIDNKPYGTELIDSETAGYNDIPMHLMGINSIIKRYENLDLAFEQVKREGRLKTRKEIRADNYLENGGILIHLGPNGTPFFGGGGIHRFAMSLILELPIIPAQIGCVHISAIPFLDDFRKPMFTTLKA